MKTATFARLAGALALASACIASQAAIVLRTGTTIGGGSAMASGAVDSVWQISINGGTTYTNSRVLHPAQICCSMDTVNPAAAWVSDPSIVAASPNTSWGVGNPVFLQVTFDLTGYSLSTVSLNGNWRVADNSLGIYLNGNLLAGTVLTSVWASDQSLAIAAGSGLFTSGINTLQMRGDSINSTWDGFYFNGAVNGSLTNAVPTPATLPLVALALVGLAASHRRKA